MDGNTPKPIERRKRVSKPVRVFIYGFGVLLILYAVALGVMSTQWFEQLLARRTAAALEEITGARVEIGKLSFRPIIFQATLRGLVLHGKEPARAPPLFSAGTVVVGINPWPALRRRKLALRSLTLEDAEIHVSTHADGSTNVPGPAGGGGDGEFLNDFLDLVVGRLDVARTNLYWNDEQVPLDLSARGVALLLALGHGGRYSGSLSSSETRLQVTRWPLPPITFSTQLEFSRDDLALTSLSWRSSGVTGTGTFNLHRFPSLQAQLNWRADGNLKELARVFRVHELQSGEVHGKGEVTYRNGDFETRGRVEGRRLLTRSSAFQPGPVDLSTDFLADRHHLEASNLVVKLLGGTARGTVTVSLAGGAPQFVTRIRIQGLDLTRSLDLIPEGRAVVSDFLAAGRVNGSIEAAWSDAFQDVTSKFDLNFDATQTSASQGSRPVSGFARGVASLAKTPVITLETAVLHFPHSVISGEGSLGAPKSALTFRVETSDFEEWRTLIQSLVEASEPVVLKSSATFFGSLAGSISHPQVQGQLRLGAFEYRGWDWDSLEATVMAMPDSVAISSGKLLAGTSSLAFDASAGLDHWKLAPDALVQLSAHADRAPLEGLRKALEIPYLLDGFATGRVNLGGRRSDLTGTGTVRIEHGTYAHEPFDLLAVEAKVSRSVWDMESIALVKGSGRLSGQAQVDPVERTLSAKAHGSNFSLGNIRSLSRLAGTTPEVEGLTGHVDFDLDARGSMDNPDVRTTLDARGLSVSGIALGDLHGQMEWKEHQAKAHGDLQGPGGMFHFGGQVRTEGDWPVELSTQTTNLRADPWMRFLRLGKFGAAVTATGSINLSGPLKNTDGLEMHSEIRKVEVSFPGLKWENDRPIDVTLANRTLTVSRFQLTGPSTRFEVEGSVRLAPPASLALRAQGQIDASLLTALDPALLTTGSCDVELRAGGSLQEPSIHGAVKVQNVSLGYPNLPFRLSGLQGEVHLEGDRLTVTSLHGASGQGEISITGFATLSDTPRFDLRADLQQARVEYPVDFTSVLTGSLRLSSTTSAAVLRGDLTVGQMFVSEDFNVLSWLGQISTQLPTTPSGAAAASPVASKVRLEVRVTSAPVVSVDSHDLRLAADIDMALRGNLARPVAFGSVRINSGQAVLRGATYTLTRGSITMSNPVETQPVLDLEAQTRVQRYNLVLNVTGPADRPRVSYRSDPPLPTPDILALLAFGYSRQEEALTAGTGRSTFGTLGATALLSQALSGQKSSRIQRLFGLSRIAIDPNPSGAGGARVTVQEQVTRDFTITYVNTTGGLQERIIQVEWDLSDKVSLLGVRDQNGVYGVELDFRRRFK